MMSRVVMALEKTWVRKILNKGRCLAALNASKILISV
jgi:hypothetical protein